MTRYHHRIWESVGSDVQKKKRKNYPKRFQVRNSCEPLHMLPDDGQQTAKVRYAAPRWAELAVEKKKTKKLPFRPLKSPGGHPRTCIPGVATCLELHSTAIVRGVHLVFHCCQLRHTAVCWILSGESSRIFRRFQIFYGVKCCHLLINLDLRRCSFDLQVTLNVFTWLNSMFPAHLHIGCYYWKEKYSGEMSQCCTVETSFFSNFNWRCVRWCKGEQPLATRVFRLLERGGGGEQHDVYIPTRMKRPVTWRTTPSAHESVFFRTFYRPTSFVVQIDGI